VDQPPQNFNPVLMQVLAALFTGASTYLLVRYGGSTFRVMSERLERRYGRILNQELLLDVKPRTAVYGAIAIVLIPGILFAWLLGHLGWFFVGALLGVFVPALVMRYLERRRKNKLELQLVDAITTLASGVRAGLTLVQAMELLVQNTKAPIRQEFEQLLREYNMGMELNQAMRNTADRIGSQHYRLLFTAIEMHRIRGGNTGESLDRIAESIREIQRLEGKLDAVTSQGRQQARMMAIFPMIILVILYYIMPTDVSLLFSDPFGRLMLLLIVAMIAAGFFWIRRIMSIDI
jgi:tight adherence protein B